MKLPTTYWLLIFLAVLSSSRADEEPNQESSSSLKLTSKEQADLLLYIQGLIHYGYNENKLDTIREIVEEFREDKSSSNVTLVGSQNIYNADGSIKEIRTIELSIPSLPEKNLIDLNLNEAYDDDDIFDSNDLGKLRDVRDTVQSLSLLGLNMDLVYLEQNQDGDVEEALYLTRDFEAMKSDGVVYINKTINVDSLEEIEAAREKLPHIELPSSILVYDKEGQFISEKSTIVPEQLAYVTSDYGTPSYDVVETTLKELANSFLKSKNRDDVLETLRGSLEKHYPGLVFAVTLGQPTGDFINKDFSVDLEYGYLDFEDNIHYTVYGYNRTT